MFDILNRTKVLKLHIGCTENEWHLCTCYWYYCQSGNACATFSGFFALKYILCKCASMGTKVYISRIKNKQIWSKLVNCENHHFYSNWTKQKWNYKNIDNNCVHTQNVKLGMSKHHMWSAPTKPGTSRMGPFWDIGHWNFRGKKNNLKVKYKVLVFL